MFIISSVLIRFLPVSSVSRILYGHCLHHLPPFSSIVPDFFVLLYLVIWCIGILHLPISQMVPRFYVFVLMLGKANHFF